MATAEDVNKSFASSVALKALKLWTTPGSRSVRPAPAAVPGLALADCVEFSGAAEASTVACCRHR